MSTRRPVVALVRGNSLNNWEGSLWNELEDEFEITGICTRKNLYATDDVTYPVQRCGSAVDYRVTRVGQLYLHGVIQHMRGLNNKLTGVDIVHTSEVQYNYTAQAVRAKKENPDLRVVVTVWDNSIGRFEQTRLPGGLRYSERLKRVIKQRMDEVVRGADYFLPVSMSSQALLQDLGVPAEKMSVLMPGVVRKESSGSASIADKIRERVGREVDLSQSVLMVNRLVVEKGVYDVLYTWKRYAATHPSATLLIVGGGPEEGRMKQLVSTWQLQDQILFVGRIPNSEVQALFTQVRLLLLGSHATPAWQEQFGYVLAEAMMAGCPVVSTATGAIPEVVGDGGIIVPPAAPWALYEALIACDDTVQYQEMQQRAAERGNFFHAQRYQDALREIYRSLL